MVIHFFAFLMIRKISDWFVHFFAFLWVWKNGWFHPGKKIIFFHIFASLCFENVFLCYENIFFWEKKFLCIFLHFFLRVKKWMVSSWKKSYFFIFLHFYAMKMYFYEKKIFMHFFAFFYESEKVDGFILK